MAIGYFDELFNANVRGVVYNTQMALPMLLKNKWVVINIASVAAEKPDPGASIYSATKAAVIALTRSRAKELARQEFA